MEEHFEKKYYLILFSSMLGPLSTNAIIPIFNLLKENFLLEEVSLISLAISFYIFPFSILQLFAGTFSDVVDKRSVVSLGFIIFLFSLVLVLISVLIRNYFLFLISFLLLGLGFSMINPTILAILNLITPTRKKGLMMGLYNSSAAIG
ncbi:MAG: MFS transporter, partial [Promethearchaeota archaeon]